MKGENMEFFTLKFTYKLTVDNKSGKFLLKDQWPSQGEHQNVPLSETKKIALEK